MIRLSHLTVLLLPLALGQAACDPDPGGASPSTVQQHLDSTLPGLIDTSAEAIAYLSESENWNRLGESFDGIAVVLGFEQDDLEPLPAAGEEELTGQEIADLLEEKLFNDANYEGDGDYLIPSSSLCPDIEISDDQGSAGFEVNQECIDMVNDVEPRVHVESAGNGLDFSLLIGPEKAAPLTLELREDSMAIVADLAEAKAAAAHIASVSGEEFELPETMEGVTAAKLTVHGSEDISVSVSIRERVAIVASIPDVGPLVYSSEAADPLFDLHLNAAEQEIGAVLALGRTQLSIPYAAFDDEESNVQGNLSIDWQGLSAALLLNDNSGGGIALTNVGFGEGQSTIKLDDTTLLSIDLNSDAGRHFALTMIPGAGNAMPSFHFDPGFALDIGVDFSPFASQDNEVPSYFLGETYSIEVESGAQLIEGIDSDGIMAIDGAIRLSSSAGVGSVEVAQGQCLLASELIDGEHELLGEYEAGACP